MRTFFWVLLVVALFSLAVWIVVGARFPKTPLSTALAFAYFVAPNVGAIWMLYRVIRFETHPLPIALLALVPYAFLWYYFERVRPQRRLPRTSAT
jgi:hypothetical protein